MVRSRWFRKEDLEGERRGKEENIHGRDERRKRERERGMKNR